MPSYRAARRGAFLPLVVGELFELGAVEAYDEDLAVGLGGAGVEGLVFEAHAGAGEGEAFAVGGPGEVGFVAGGVGELLEVLAVGMDSEDFEVAVDAAGECDEIVAWGPDGEVVVFAGERGDGVVFEIHDAEAFPVRAGSAVDDVFAVGREGGERIVVGAGGDEAKAGSVGVDDGDLVSAVYGVDLLFAADGEVEEGREAADSEYDLAAVGGPLRGEHELFAIQDGAGGLSFVDD